MRVKLPILALFFLASAAHFSSADLQEDLMDVRQESLSGVITQSAELSEDQKKAIQLALSQIFSQQAASTSVYGQIVNAMAVAMEAPRVRESGERFFAGLKELIIVFFKDLRLPDQQLAKMRDLLQTFKSLAQIQLDHLNPQSVDDAINNRILMLQERLAAHILPLSAGMQEVLSQESVNGYQKKIIQMFIDLIKQALDILPQGLLGPDAGNPPSLSEPFIPERIEPDQGSALESE